MCSSQVMKANAGQIRPLQNFAKRLAHNVGVERHSIRTGEHQAVSVVLLERNPTKGTPEYRKRAAGIRGGSEGGQGPELPRRD